MQEEFKELTRILRLCEWLMVLLKKVNGRTMVIERHFYAIFFILIAVGMTVAIVTIEVILPEADARHEESGGTEPHCYTSACEKRFP